MQKAMNYNDVAIVSVKGSDYRIHFLCMSKDDAINITRNSEFFFKKWVIRRDLNLIFRFPGETWEKVGVDGRNKNKNIVNFYKL